MKTIDFAPLYQSTVGFERLFTLLDRNERAEWPPYNIEKTGEATYSIVMAVAGFGPDEIELHQNGAVLLVAGRKALEQTERRMLHQGIAFRSFKQSFNLADHVKVVAAGLDNGLLTIDLKREVPEPLQPRRIEIGAGQDQGRIGIDRREAGRVKAA